eukprot:CAMPEP_0204908874 /NCGR_PEP_ID=MMETSP1397-20131031/7738_1 /ASSEMBLY_ACC=CAM_ASM_000891 /TAXON_ID=49980 /ORGANISM="Climacostomum Climacostomum virens, Strain Stock W-24" /LENGTH=51 /DNA_ID=CAMNT_0052078557 /DNA_START=601 /DNA_END=756 /DNA_ORIENTATION=-
MLKLASAGFSSNFKAKLLAELNRGMTVSAEVARESLQAKGSSDSLLASLSG